MERQNHLKDGGSLMSKKNWYNIKEAAPFGVDPFGQGELSDKVKTQPWGNLGGDSRYGLFEPSSGKSHPNDYFSESKEQDPLEKRLEKLKEKKKKNKRKKKRKETQKKESWNYSFSTQELPYIEGKESSPSLPKLAQWGVHGPRLPRWQDELLQPSSYAEEDSGHRTKLYPNKEKKKNVKKTGFDGDLKSPLNPYKSALKSSVTIRSADNDSSEIGSGFFINENMILTCFHVVAPKGNPDSATIQVTKDGENFLAKVFAFDSKNDTAILITQDVESNTFFPLCSSEVEQGEDVIVIGTPLGFENLIGEGIVSSGQEYQVESDGPPYLFISADIAPGNSGGPVVCKKNNAIVGMAAAVVTMDDSTSGLNAAIPVSTLKEFLDGNGIKYRKI